MDCERIENDEIIEKYLTGKLDQAEQKAFESHFFGCPKCFGKLQVLRALQEELWESDEPALPEVAKPARLWSRPWQIAAAASAAIVLIVAVLWRGSGGIKGTSVGPAGESSVLGTLARFDPPAYVPPTLRGAADEATERFRAGMRFYQKGDYTQAIPELRSAAGVHPQAANVRFFLGICLLLAGQTDAGIGELKQTVDLSDSAYLAEAHFYLAKAFLGKGEASRARKELKAVVELRGRFGDEAARLLKLIK
jgi:tetratricopeptide (TPR) repeat protein